MKYNHFIKSNNRNISKMCSGFRALLAAVVILVHVHLQTCDGATPDCSENRLGDNTVLTACLDAVESALSTAYPTGHVTSSTQLNTYITLKWMSASETHNVCCEDATFSNQMITLMPFVKDALKAEDIRNSPSMHMAGEYQNGDPHFYLIGLFDVSDSGYGNAQLPYVHWMVNNVQHGNVTDSNNRASYLPPIDPSGYYVMMVWKQERSGLTMRMDNFARHDDDMSSPCPMPDRCFFEISDLITHAATMDNGLTLIGATWFRINSEGASKPYEAYRRIRHMDQPEGEVCHQVMGTELVNQETHCHAAQQCNGVTDGDPAKATECLRITRDYLASQTSFVKQTDTLYLHTSPTLTSGRFVQDNICCRNISEPSATATVNPVDGKTYKNYLAQTLPTATYVTTDPDGVGVGHNELYTLMIMDIDVDALNNNYATQTEPLLHMLYANVHSTNITAGTPLRPYHVMSRPHRYLWLEYKQVNNAIVQTNTDMATYTGAHDTCLVPNSCFFNHTKFLEAFPLTLVGATMIDFTGAGKEFYAYNLINTHNKNETMVCTDLFDTKATPQGTVDCTVSSDTPARLSTSGVLLVAAIVVTMVTRCLH